MEFAIVKAGHDRGQIYLIVESEENFVYLVNGGTRPFGRPKKKNRKHVQVVKHIPRETAESMEEPVPGDQRVKKAIRSLKKHINNQTLNESENEGN